MSPIFCQKSPIFYQKVPTFGRKIMARRVCVFFCRWIRKIFIFCQKSPILCPKSPILCQKSPTLRPNRRQKSLTFCPKSCQKSPTFCRNIIAHRVGVLLSVDPKDLYILPKEPYTLSKEPYILPKEPYILPKDHSSRSRCSFVSGSERSSYSAKRAVHRVEYKKSTYVLMQNTELSIL